MVKFATDIDFYVVLWCFHECLELEKEQNTIFEALFLGLFATKTQFSQRNRVPHYSTLSGKVLQ